MHPNGHPRARLFLADLARRSHDPEDCPRCGSRDIWPELAEGPYGLYCRGCGWGGPRVSAADDYPDEALFAWNDEAHKIAQARELGLTLNLVQPKEDAVEAC